MKRHFLELTISGPGQNRYSSTLTLDELPLLLVELEIAATPATLAAIRNALVEHGVATLQSQPDETITVTLIEE